MDQLTTDEIKKRARAYLSKMPEALEGQKGSFAAFKVALTLVKGFALSIPDAREVWSDYNGRCVPPWSEQEIQHKLADALKSPKPEGYLLKDTPRNRKPEAEYIYTDEKGTTLFKVLRYPGKEFSISPSGGMRPVLYKLPKVKKAIADHSMILLVEGEKDVGTAFHLGYTATTNSNGVGSWRREHADQLRGAHVVIIPDRDKAGFVGFCNRAETLLETAASLYMLELPTGKDLTEWVEQGGNAESLSGLLAHLTPLTRENLQSFKQAHVLNKMESPPPRSNEDFIFTPPAKEETFPEGVSFDFFKPETEEDPDELIRGTEHGKGRVLCKKHLALLSGHAGVGKSTLILQMAILFSLGKPFFGFTPTRPLKIFIFQAENDRRDMWEKINGTIKNLHLEADAEGIKRNLIFEKESCGKVRKEFVEWVSKCHDKNKPDLIIADPLFAYFGGDVSDQGKTSDWIRSLFALCQKKEFAMIIVHHFNKPKGQDHEATVYSGSGSSELMNTARIVINIEKKKGDIYRLSVFKRDARLGWLDRYGQRTNEILIKRAQPPEEYWLELDENDIADLGDAGKKNAINTGAPVKYPLDAVLTVMKEKIDALGTQGLTRKEFWDACHKFMGMSARTFDHKLNELVGKGEIRTLPVDGLYQPKDFKIA